MIYITTIDSRFGKMTLAGDGEGLSGLWIEGQKYHSASIGGGSTAEAEKESAVLAAYNETNAKKSKEKNAGLRLINKDELAVFLQAEEWLKAYFNGEKPPISDLKLSPKGGEFRQEVWRILCAIPYGEVITYGDIAKELALRQGKTRMSAQAVGGAVGHNPISIIIPCHRVVGANGNLTGYAGGLDIKIRLLTFEGLDMSRFYVPQKGTAL